MLLPLPGALLTLAVARADLAVERAATALATGVLAAAAAALLLSAGLSALSRAIGFPAAALLFGALFALLALAVHPLGRARDTAVGNGGSRPTPHRSRRRGRPRLRIGKPLSTIALTSVSRTASAICKDEWVSRFDTTSHKGLHDMDKDRIKGTVKQAEGTIKETVGQATGDTSLEIEGKVEKAEGTVQKAFGKVKDAFRKG